MEGLNLIERSARPAGRGARPYLRVLSDDGQGDAYDDPGDSGDRYLTILGSVIASDEFSRWAAPELVAYLAATLAPGYARASKTQVDTAGGGTWFRPVSWFAQPGRYGADTVRIAVPFATATLERGLKSHIDNGLIKRDKIERDPQTHQEFQGKRNLYTNRFNTLGAGIKLLPLEKILPADDED